MLGFSPLGPSNVTRLSLFVESTDDPERRHSKWAANIPPKRRFQATLSTRLACRVRRVSQGGQLDQPAWLAARAAIQELRPDLDQDTAGRQASAAVHYASVFHTKWLWHRVGDPKYWLLSRAQQEAGGAIKHHRLRCVTVRSYLVPG
jgi:hypothetical protein